MGNPAISLALMLTIPIARRAVSSVRQKNCNQLI